MLLLLDYIIYLHELLHHSNVRKYITVNVVAYAMSTSTVSVLAQSGLTTVITAPGLPRYAEYAAYNYPINISAVPTARWIWDGPGNTIDCKMNITVKHEFTIKCLNEPLKLYISADNWYVFQLLGTTGNGTDWSPPKEFSVSTVGVSCGIQLNN